jgi:excisionase family DNA binding protein
MTRDPDILSADEAAALLGIGRRQVYEGARRGDIPCCRVGRSVLFSRRRLDAWLHGAPAHGTESRGSHGAEQEQHAPVSRP